MRGSVRRFVRRMVGTWSTDQLGALGIDDLVQICRYCARWQPGKATKYRLNS